LSTAQTDTHEIKALINQGKALAAQGQYEEAITYYDKALEIDPTYLDALNNKGTVLKEQGQ